MTEDGDLKKVKFVFDVYGDGETMDAALAIEGIRALNLNPTIDLVNSLGGTDKPGESSLSIDDFWKIYVGVRDDKNMGGLVDFIECLKIYDVGENGLMKLVDLTTMLLTLGEKITDKQLDEVMADCQLEEEDDDGWFPYLPFLCRLCEQPVPKSWKPT